MRNSRFVRHRRRGLCVLFAFCLTGYATAFCLAGEGELVLLAIFNAHQQVCQSTTGLFTAAQGGLIEAFAAFRGFDPAEGENALSVKKLTTMIVANNSGPEKARWCMDVHGKLGQMIRNISQHGSPQSQNSQ